MIVIFVVSLLEHLYPIKDEMVIGMLPRYYAPVYYPRASTVLHGVTLCDCLWVCLSACPEVGHVFRPCRPVANQFEVSDSL